MEDGVVYGNTSMAGTRDGRQGVLAYYSEVIAKTPEEARFVLDNISAHDGRGRVSVTWSVCCLGWAPCPQMMRGSIVCCTVLQYVCY